MPLLRVRDRTWNLEEAGSGEPTLVLLHSWGADLSSLAGLAVGFAPRHRVISVDLPGCGQSTAGGDSSIEGIAADLAVLVWRRGVHLPVLVGHGLGAVVALEMARNLQQFLTALVLVEPAPIVLEARWQSAPPGIAPAAWAELLDWDGDAAASACAAPTLLIESARPHNDLAALRALFPRLETAHFPDVERDVHRERSDEVQAAIAGFLRRRQAPAARDSLAAAPVPGRPEATELPEDVVAFLRSGQGGLSSMMGTCDARGRPEVTRLVGGRLHEDRRHVTVYLPVAAAERTLANVRETGRAALTFGRLTDHHAVQLKGRLVSERAGDESDRPVVDAMMDAAVGTFGFVGIPEALMRRVSHWPVRVLEVAITDAFVQTPGPGAGHRLQG